MGVDDGQEAETLIMQKLADEEWIARARARFASEGDWDTEPWPPHDPDAEPEEQSDGPRCPYCEHHPHLMEFRRYEAISRSPLLVCNTCYGFWATVDSLTNGVADIGEQHPALRSAMAPRRCRSCGGHLKPDSVCTKCQKPLQRLNCPICHTEMERFVHESITLDACKACNGTWYDTGELGAAFKIEPYQGLAASTVDEKAAEPEHSILLQAAAIVARIFLPF